jgi:hypothetical protein
MSDHPEVPRVEFDDDGESMNVEQAVAKFRRLLTDMLTDLPGCGVIEHSIKIEMRPCDCDSDIRGRDSYCPLHGDKA